MSNVKHGEGSAASTVPGVLHPDGPVPMRFPPETIHHEVSGAHAKAKMNFEHAQLGPEQHYTEGEEADVSSREAEKEHEHAKGGVHHPDGEHGGARSYHGHAARHKEDGHKVAGKHHGKEHEGKKPKHRSTSGAPGHGIVGN